MALRIGALVLATCNLISAEFLASPYNLRIHDDQDDCDEHDGHKDHYGIKAHPGDSSDHSYAHKPIVASPLVIQDHVIGGGHKDASHPRPSNVNIDIPDVNFKPLKEQPRGATKDLKAPITIVTVPRISTAEPTSHVPVDNHNYNESNLPEHKDTNNFSAKKDLLTYNNLLSTKVGPVKAVRVVEEEDSSEECSSSEEVKAPQVRPGRLQHRADHQIAVGKAIENAPTVIRTYRVGVDQPRRHHHHHDHNKDHYINHAGSHRPQQAVSGSSGDSHKEDSVTLGVPVHPLNSNSNDPFLWLYNLVGHK